jgi:23S rRNA pseudouridine1911/1915/1917 synthase
MLAGMCPTEVTCFTSRVLHHDRRPFGIADCLNENEKPAHRNRFGMSNSRRLTVAEPAPLLSYLLGALPWKRGVVKNLLKLGAIVVNGEAVRQFDHPLAVGDEVLVRDCETTKAESRLRTARIRVVYEDADLIVLDKPAGLLTVGTDNDKSNTLLFRLNEYLRLRPSAAERRAFVVHRLDRETSGLVLFAKNEPLQRRLQAAWSEVNKTYLAIVEGCPDPPQGTIRTYLVETSALHVFSNDHQVERGRLAVTHYRLLQTPLPFSWQEVDFSLLEVRIETGRKHQIRVHLAGLGCTITGDRRYGAKLDPFHRLALHATRLALVHPQTGESLQFESPLPAALRRKPDLAVEE